jgi:type VI protein secretion system component VasF
VEGAAKRVRAGGRPHWNAVSYQHTERWRERFEPVIFGGVAIWALALMGIGMWTVIQWIVN